MTSILDNPFIQEEPDFGFAWAAGLFEGEGTICAVKAGNTMALRIAIGMVDKDIIDRFHSIVGVGVVNGPYAGRKQNHKPIWYWRLGRRSEQIEFVSRIWPYLGERRRQQVIETYEKITPITQPTNTGRPRLAAVA